MRSVANETRRLRVIAREMLCCARAMHVYGLWWALGRRASPEEVRDVGPVDDPQREEEDREDDATPLHRRGRRAEAWGGEGRHQGCSLGRGVASGKVRRIIGRALASCSIGKRAGRPGYCFITSTSASGICQ